MKREYRYWHSPALNRRMELLVFGHSGTPVLIFPTREGRFFDYENWGLVGSVSDSVHHGNLQLFCVDSLDSETFYQRGSDPAARIRRHNQYERYILEEVLPFIQYTNPSNSLISHGCSIGGYHAANIAFRHPHLFGKVVALSGRYDLTRPMGSFPDLFDGYYSEDIYFHMPTHFLPNLTDSQRLNALKRLDVVLAVGEADYFRPSNDELSGALATKNVPHRLAIWDGKAHCWAAWRRMVPTYL